MENQGSKLIVILGFTGSGKSDLAVQLAKEYNGEIISADSRQIYKEMDIGTGKVIGQWREGKYVYQDINHYLLDFLKIAKPYSVGEYKEAADKAIAGVMAGGKSTILCGGTAQYLYAVIDNWQIPRVEPDLEFRQDLEAQLSNQNISINELWNWLIEQDPEAAEFVQPDNPRRIIRALEVIKASGEKFSKLRKKKPSPYDPLIISLQHEREKLYEKVDERVDQMMLEGLEKEATSLLIKYGVDAPGLQTIGYQEFVPYLKKESSLEEVVQKIKFNTHRYVRYQNSWFNKDERIKWVNDITDASKLVGKFLFK